MAFNPKFSGGFTVGKRQRRQPMSEINVTPMVDVMLVLLVIFMVTAPMLTVGVTVDLPKTKAAAVPGDDEPLAISIDAEGKIFLQETLLDLEGLVPRLLAITANNQDVRIFVRGDKTIDYGRVMEVMGTVNSAGFRKVALITEHMSGPSFKKRAK
ncbi:MAG: protein TolR [Magnetovibrio sp.]|nr:protein TolR [Magnetovibrio sp.]|tara:strand:+ start:450 stop:914 length:465 start_codon:yes stop_codon:yes gene_type:complete